MLGWLLAGIFNHAALAEKWVFKGGTCLNKCYFETYRFSEDLDFTLTDESHLNVDFLIGTFREIAAWVYEQTGVELPADEQGRRSVRIIEPYSLRQTQVGDILLHAVRADNQQHRSYRIDRIRGARATQLTFAPRYTIELTPTGPISSPPATYAPRMTAPRVNTRSSTSTRSGPLCLRMRLLPQEVRALEA